MEDFSAVITDLPQGMFGNSVDHARTSSHLFI